MRHGVRRVLSFVAALSVLGSGAGACASHHTQLLADAGIDDGGVSADARGGGDTRLDARADGVAGTADGAATGLDARVADADIDGGVSEDGGGTGDDAPTADASIDGGANVPTEEATLLASGGAAGDWFGWSVALSSDGSRALVGARYDDSAGGTDAGTARVFVRTGATWMEEATLFASGGGAFAAFGHSVALSSDGSRALVGAPEDDTSGGVGAGSARVFLRTGATWAEEATLIASRVDGFGLSVAMSSDGSRALVGAPNNEIAVVFLRTGAMWVEEATLIASGAVVGDDFGCSVALSSDGSQALVGASRDDTVGGAEVGSARVFLRTGATWVEEATLLASGGAANDRFGVSVALSSDGSRALVGAPGVGTAGAANVGSARVFARTGAAWVEEATILASGGAVGDWFGVSVALSADGSRALVGAYRDDTAGGTNAGSARGFVRSGATWVEATTLLASSGARRGFAWFGYSVALSSDGSRALVGAYGDERAGGTDTGSARVFVLP